MSEEITPPIAIVVNQDPAQCIQLVGLLHDAGVAHHSFGTAEDALVFMSTQFVPDIIITAIRLPGVDGWQFCRLLRSPDYPHFNAIPVLVVSTTFAGDDPEQLAADIGANRFLSAPVDADQFTACVNALLAGAHTPHVVKTLVVEDNPTTAGLLQRALTSHGYAVTLAPDLEAATAAIQTEAYHLAIIDYVLPDGKGDQLLAVLRAHTSRCACIMITGLANPALALTWMKQGAAAYLLKPFDMGYLIEVCARVRRERAMVRATHLLEARVKEVEDRDIQHRVERAQAERNLQAAIRKQQRLTEHLQAVREHEQRRLAVWLHDDVGQLLTRMRMDVMLLEGAPANEIPDMAEILSGLKQTMDEALDSVRRIATNMRPAILDDFGLIAALNWSIREDQRRLGIPIRFEAENVPDELPEKISVTLYRMARECLTNIARHAQATSVMVRLTVHDGLASLTVCDDGCGLPPEVVDAPESFGLYQLRERTEAFGGALEIESQPGQGTTIRMKGLRL